MVTENRPPLTSAEIGILWNQYVLDSLSLCIEKSALRFEQDNKIRSIITESIKMLEESTKTIADLFRKEEIPMPEGFDEDDIYPSSAPLFTSIFRLRYLKYKLNFRLPINGLNLAQATRNDVRKLFHTLTTSTINMDERATTLMLDRGLYVRPPYITLQDKKEYITQPGFLGSFFGENTRKLLAIEIAGLFQHIQNNLLGKELLLGFSKVVNSPELKEYLLRGVDIAQKHIDILSAMLTKNDIPVPQPSDSGVTNSTDAPFSERLILQHVIILNQAGISAYSTSMAQSMRNDLLSLYLRLCAEIGQYLQGGTGLQMENHWLEEPPKVASYRDYDFLQ